MHPEYPMFTGMFLGLIAMIIIGPTHRWAVVIPVACMFAAEAGVRIVRWLDGRPRRRHATPPE